MDDSQKDEARKKFEDGLRRVSKLPAEDRIDIYERLFGADGEGDIARIAISQIPLSPNTAVFRRFSRENAEISEDGFVVLRKPRVFLSHSHSDRGLARRIYKYVTL